jgi:hypothetical protein
MESSDSSSPRTTRTRSRLGSDLLFINTRVLTIAQIKPRSAIPNTIGSAVLRVHSIPLGESSPPAPGDRFGRDDLIEKLVGFAEDLKPSLSSAQGGLGRPLLPSQSSATIGLKNDLAKTVDLSAVTNFRLPALISLPDSPGISAEEHSVVEELCQYKTIPLLITSRVTTVPPRCRRLEIPALSMEAACDSFYDIYSGCRRSSIINDLLKSLDFHALSITLLATTASHNARDHDRLAKGWDTRRA